MKNILARTILMKEYTKICGELFADFYIHSKAEGEEKKAVEANDFMNAILTGKNIREEWKLENTENYKKLVEIVHSINILSKE